MTCDRYRPQLALLVGNDLDPREASEVRQHLVGCAACQAQWNALQASTSVLQTVSRQTSIPSSGNLWPKVRAKLNSQPTNLTESVPGWGTVGAFAAVCAAVMWLTVSTPIFDFDLDRPGIAEMEGPRNLRRPASNRLPELHLVDDTQPLMQISANGEVSPQLQTPPSSFGDPRSF